MAVESARDQMIAGRQKLGRRCDRVTRLVGSSRMPSLSHYLDKNLIALGRDGPGLQGDRSCCSVRVDVQPHDGIDPVQDAPFNQAFCALDGFLFGLKYGSYRHVWTFLAKPSLQGNNRSKQNRRVGVVAARMRGVRHSATVLHVF